MSSIGGKLLLLPRPIRRPNCSFFPSAAYMSVMGPDCKLSGVPEPVYFGPYKIDPKEIFMSTEHSFAMVNLRPVVPDVLVSSKRVVPRFADLSVEEATDIWLAARNVGCKVEAFYNASSLTFTIQDGREAGQTVPHVHIHVLPRRAGDFKNNDDIYDEIDKKEKELPDHLNLDIERKDRTLEEMASEAAELRKLF